MFLHLQMLIKVIRSFMSFLNVHHKDKLDKKYWFLSSIEHLQTCYLGIVAHATNHFILNLPLIYWLFNVWLNKN
jgi:hypothetical protein